jgi:hypothetical protein
LPLVAVVRLAVGNLAARVVVFGRKLAIFSAAGLKRCGIDSIVDEPPAED